MEDARVLLNPILYLPTKGFEGVLRLRNFLYSREWVRPFRLPGPVISVGNITLGGAGKTPLVIHLARLLLESGHVPAILTRGYGRQESGRAWIVAPGDRIANPAARLGDEPALIRRSVAGAWLGVSHDRVTAGIEIARRVSNPVFLLDDGFQHRRVQRDLDIVVLDPTQALDRDSLFPMGRLREPLSGLRRSGLIVFNSLPSSACREFQGRVAKICPGVSFLHAEQKIARAIVLEQWLESSDSSAWEPKGRSVFLVTALGNPVRFKRDVRLLGATIKGWRFYRDHYALSPADWASSIRAARDTGSEAILMTEKDAIKLSTRPEYPAVVCVQTTEIAERSDLEAKLRGALEAH